MAVIEEFPIVREWTATDRTGEQRTGITRYRFVPIDARPGWTTYSGQQCHEGRDGLLIEDAEHRWWEQDLWGAQHERYYLDIGCYGGVQKYVCYALTPDWRGELLERVAFDSPEEAAAWALSWMADPETQRQRCSR